MGGSTMEQSDRRWTVSCAACDIVIGSVDKGRFVHDPACPEPQVIGRGTMRCCRCGGTLAVVEVSGEPSEGVEDAPPPRLHDLAIGLSALRAREARQRG